MADEGDEETEVTYMPVVVFPDQSPSFSFGFEAGGIFEQMRTNEPEISGVLHAENEEVYRRIANYKGYEMVCCPTEPPSEGWLAFSFRKKRPSGRTLYAVKNEPRTFHLEKVEEKEDNVFFAKPPKNSCNRHSNCEVAEYEERNKGRTNFVNFHCHDEECPDCFGSN